MKEFLTRLEEMQREFISVFGLEYKGDETDKMYLDFLFEEAVEELNRAIWNKNAVEFIDAIADTIYVVSQYAVLKMGDLKNIGLCRNSVGLHNYVMNEALHAGSIQEIGYIINMTVSEACNSNIRLFSFDEVVKSVEIVHRANMNKAHIHIADAAATCDAQSFECYIEAIGEDFNDKVLVNDLFNSIKYDNYKWFVVKQGNNAPMPHKVVKPFNWHGPEDELRELLNG